MKMKKVCMIAFGAVVLMAQCMTIAAREEVGAASKSTTTNEEQLKNKRRRDQQGSSVSTQYHRTTVTRYSLLDKIKGWFGIKSEPKTVVIRSEVSSQNIDPMTQQQKEK